MIKDDPFIRILAKADKHHVELMQLIGRVCTSFAAIESRVCDLLSLMINAEKPEIGRAVVDEQPFTRTVRLLKMLAARPDALHQIPDLDAMLKRLEKAAYMRNELIHSAAMIVPSEDGMVSLNKVRHRNTKKEPIKRIKQFTDIRKTTDFIELLKRDIDSLYMKMIRENAEK